MKEMNSYIAYREGLKWENKVIAVQAYKWKLNPTRKRQKQIKEVFSRMQ
jgi:hypothetical protein